MPSVTKVLLIVVIIITSSMTGCLSDSSEQKASQIEALEREVLELENLLTISDIISLHIPLNKETSNLIDEKKLRLIKDSSVIINTARGGIIDENALAQLLKEDKIGGAALDVFNEEPLKKEHAKKFKGIDNLILTPHIGGVTKESNERVSQMIAKKIDMHLSK